MQIAILIVIFVVTALGMPEATDHIVSYYNDVYSDEYAYIALFFGMIINTLLGV